MIPSAEMKFLFLVTISFVLDLHDPQSIGFFLSLSTGNILSLELVTQFLLEVWCGNGILVTMSDL